MVKKSLIVFATLIVTLFHGAIASAQNRDSLYVANNAKWIAFAAKGNFDSALYYIKKIQNLADSFYWGTPRSAFSHTGLAVTYQAMGSMNLASAEVKKSVNLFETAVLTHDTSTLANYLYREALLQFVNIYQVCGAYNDAYPRLLQLQRLCRVYKDTSGYSRATVALALHNIHFGDYGRALILYDSLEQLVMVKKDLSNFLNPNSLYTSVSAIYTEMGDAPKSLLFIKKANAYCCTAAKLQTADYLSLHDAVPAMINLADSYREMHYTDSARLVLGMLGEKIKGNALLGEANAGLLQEQAAIYTDEHKYNLATTLYRQSLAIMDTLQGRSDYYDPTLINLAKLYQLSGNYSAADSIYRKEITYLYANGLWTSYNMQQAITGLCRNLVYQSKNQEAADSLVVAANIARRVLSLNFLCMAEQDKLQYSAAFEGIFDMLYTLLAHGGNFTGNTKKLAFQLQMQRKNTVLASQAVLLSRLRATSDTVVLGIYSEWITAREMLARQYSLPYSDRFLNTDSLEQVSEELEKRASARGYVDGFNVTGITPDKFLAQEKNTANIEFVRYNNISKKTDEENAFYGAFIIKGGDSMAAFVPLCTEGAIIKLMQGENGHFLSNEQLAQKFYTPGAAGASAVYRLTWQPLEKYLQGGTIINYSAAGLLNNIAFNALYNGKNHLANSYSLRCFSSLNELSDVKTGALPPKQISLWGNMDYDSSSYTIDTTNDNNQGQTKTVSLYADGIKPAAQSKSISKAPLVNFYTDELGAIKKIFASANAGYNSFEKAAATEEKFKQLSPQMNGVLHISTHGFYTPYNKKDADAQLPGSFISGNANPLFRCGLAFAGVNYYWMKGQPRPNHDDGILTGYEVSQLDLHNVQLVTLSACETGLGDITATEGNLGLQRAFKLAGVKNLLVSLWQVPAKQTQQLLTKFYGYWLSGKTPAQALQLAETDMQKLHYPPYYWAGFVLVE